MLFRGFRQSLKKLTHQQKTQFPAGNPGLLEQQPLSADIDTNIDVLRIIFDRCADVVMRRLKISAPEPVNACLIYINGLIDGALVSDHVMQAVQLNPALSSRGQKINGANVFTLVRDYFLSVTEVKDTGEMAVLVDNVLAGGAALIIDGSPIALIATNRGKEGRNVEEPVTEPVVRGPRDGFSERLYINTTLLRQRVKTPDLKMEISKIGVLTRTEVALAYVEGVANPATVEEVRRRLQRINIDGVLESGYIQELIEDQPLSPFPQVSVTERPDKVAANLLEGYIALLIDTTPMALIVPATFPALLQSAEDYYLRFPYAMFIRFLRFVAILITLLLPSLYIAIITFHQEMLPTPLLVSIASQREGVPFPAFVEALFMEFLFEVLREAGIRLPRTIGQAVSIVGALVIGDAAVNAGLVSPAMVMVVSLTAIASFTIPSIGASYTLRLLRFPIMFLAAAFGLFGIMASLMALLFHLCALRSFGVPYLSPVAPMNFGDMKDLMVRVPWWAMVTRPHLIGYKNLRRQGSGQMPGSRYRGDKDSFGSTGKGDRGGA